MPQEVRALQEEHLLLASLSQPRLSVEDEVIRPTKRQWLWPGRGRGD